MRADNYSLPYIPAMDFGIKRYASAVVIPGRYGFYSKLVFGCGCRAYCERIHDFKPNKPRRIVEKHLCETHKATV